MINLRKKLEVNEKNLLSSYASLSSESIGRSRKEKKCELSFIRVCVDDVHVSIYYLPKVIIKCFYVFYIIFILFITKASFFLSNGS